MGRVEHVPVCLPGGIQTHYGIAPFLCLVDRPLQLVGLEKRLVVNEQELVLNQGLISSLSSLGAGPGCLSQAQYQQQH